MYPLGLSNAHREAFEDALTDSHVIRLRFLKYDDGDWTQLPADHILDGQVDVDVTADIWRTLTLSALDPKHKLRLDKRDPSDGSIGEGTIMRVRVGIWVESITDWVDIDVFTGPIHDLSRDGDTLSLTAQGKESLFQPPYGSKSKRIFGWQKGDKITDILTRAAHFMGEENKFISIPDLPHRTHYADAVVFEGDRSLWQSMQRLVHRMPPLNNGSQWFLFYDGAGILRLEHKPIHNSIFLFSDEPNHGEGRVLGKPSFQESIENVHNYVLVTGHKYKGHKKPVQAHANADEQHPKHPYAPSNLGTSDNPHYLPLYVDMPHLHTKQACFDHAKARLESALTNSFDGAFESTPIYHLEEHDRVRVRVGDVDHTLKLRTFTFPLTTNGTMSVGYNKRAAVKNVKPHHHKKRHHKRHHGGHH